MKKEILQTIYNILDLLGLWFDSSFDYYKEHSKKLSVYFYCRQNKYTKRKYFRTMRPVMGCSTGIWDDNEWIEYTNKIDDIIL